MTDLKRAMSALSSLPPPLTSIQKARQTRLATALTNLLQDFPNLGTPSALHAPTSDAASYFPSTGQSESSSFFTPPRKGEVYARLTVRAEEAGHSANTRDLVERCREIWGIESRREKEKQLEALVGRWAESIGTLEERDWGDAVTEGVKNLDFGSHDGGQLPPILSTLLSNLLALLSTSVSSIFPTASVPPPPPPPSLLPILKSGSDIFLRTPEATKTLSSLGDELTASASGEYVAAVGHMMGGVGQDGEGARKLGDGGKDWMVEGFEKVAEWMDREVANVRKIWGHGLGA